METIVFGLDSFKGSLDSLTAGRAAASALAGIYHTVVVPVADGGEGTVEALTFGHRCRSVVCDTVDPLGRPIKARYVRQGSTAYVAVADASGLPLLKPSERNPLLASSYGTGLLIRHAIDAGCRRVVLGVGGSACVDGGVGLLSALGFRFLDGAGEPVGQGGGELRRIAAVDSTTVSDEVRTTSFIVLCDVDNPLCGPRGAAVVFAPQKGAGAEEVRVLEAGLSNLSSFMPAGVAELPGAGAAGGIAAGMKAWLAAALMPGAKYILDSIGFDDIIRGAALVVTGEGRLDATTLNGKAPLAVMEAARAQGIPCAAFGGCVDAPERLVEAGFVSVCAITPAGMPVDEAMKPDVAAANLAEAVRRMFLS